MATESACLLTAAVSGYTSYLAEFEPTADGTIVHMRMAAPRSRKELIMMKAAQPMLRAAMRTSETTLIGWLDAELRQRGEDLPEQPGPPQPRSESVLRDLPAWR